MLDASDFISQITHYLNTLYLLKTNSKLLIQANEQNLIDLLLIIFSKDSTNKNQGLLKELRYHPRKFVHLRIAFREDRDPIVKKYLITLRIKDLIRYDINKISGSLEFSSQDIEKLKKINEIDVKKKIINAISNYDEGLFNTLYDNNSSFSAITGAFDFDVNKFMGSLSPLQLDNILITDEMIKFLRTLDLSDYYKSKGLSDGGVPLNYIGYSLQDLDEHSLNILSRLLVGDFLGIKYNYDNSSNGHPLPIEGSEYDINDFESDINLNPKEKEEIRDIIKKDEAIAKKIINDLIDILTKLEQSSLYPNKKASYVKVALNLESKHLTEAIENNSNFMNSFFIEKRRISAAVKAAKK